MKFGSVCSGIEAASVAWSPLGWKAKASRVTAYYNEHDPYAAAWLRNLIDAGHIAPGVVDERSIEDVRPDELAGFTQCHFFAGIGVWSYALRQAGWPDDRPVWTGSCPCQPFSTAGKGAGFADERHLWPAFFHLIEQLRPDCVMGEQVASRDGLAWIDLVLADLEGACYAAGAVDTCAAGFGAPHIRQRLYWVADASSARLEGRDAGAVGRERQTAERSGSACGMANHLVQQRPDGQLRLCAVDEASGRVEGAAAASGLCGAGGMADADRERRGGERLLLRPEEIGRVAGDFLEATRRGEAGGMANPAEQRRPGDARAQPGVPERAHATVAGGVQPVWPGPTNGHWRDVDWLGCRDGKWRPVEPGTFPLAHGAAARVGRLRAYGNAIVAPQAVEVIRAFMGVAA